MLNTYIINKILQIIVFFKTKIAFSCDICQYILDNLFVRKSDVISVTYLRLRVNLRMHKISKQVAEIFPVTQAVDTYS